MTAPSVESLLGAAAIAAVRRPIAEARGLPAKAYTSEAFFRLEQTTLFPRRQRRGERPPSPAAASAAVRPRDRSL